MESSVLSSERHRTPKRRGPAPRRQVPALLLERRADAQVWATTREGVAKPVIVFRCFPWTEPDRFVSLRDEDGDEVALVRDASDLEPASRKVLEDALVEAGFVLEIDAIISVEEEIEIRCWKVQTRQGERSFQTPRDEWPREVPGGGLLIRDVSGDLFFVSDPAALDDKSRRLLWAFVD